MKTAPKILILLFISSLSLLGQTVQDFPEPGLAQVKITATGFSVSNAVLQQSWIVNGGRIQGGEVLDRMSNRAIHGPKTPFLISLSDGHVVDATALTITKISNEDLRAAPGSSRMIERFAGKAIRVAMADPASDLRLIWTTVLRDGSSYVRQELELTAGDKDVPIVEIRLLNWELPDAHVVGTVKGSPIVSGSLFAGFEHPLSSCAVALGRAVCRVERELPLKAHHSITYSSVIGVTASGQLRRGFLRYIERERAHPYRPFLHYNSWYDLGYFDRYSEAGALDVIHKFGDELTRRGVKLSSFLFDDGWDDPTTLWQFNRGFPEGFKNVRTAAEQYGAEPGVWLSPWGGYDKPKQERVAAARAAGYEVVDNGLALSGPKYYRLFRDTCLNMIREYGVNQFKFDGTGNANRVFPGSEFDSDFDAAITLIRELRQEKPNLYVNLTTGTYPSPFWLRYADSIWRGGEDHSFLGVGSKREQWITYRDADTFEHVVMNGPLFPLNSLMLHGLIYAKYARDLNTDPAGDFKNEIRDYFGTGTQLQEMYITPSLLSKADWDNLAEAAKWSAANADVLVDTHWIGGDPAQLAVYGWASWSRRKGILTLRNPSDHPQKIGIDLAKVFELPAGMNAAYSLRSPWKEDAEKPSIVVQPGQIHEFELQPFEVLVLEASRVSG